MKALFVNPAAMTFPKGRPPLGQGGIGAGCLGALFLLLTFLPASHAQDVMTDMAFFAAIKDRSTGTPGCEKAADYILKSFKDAGLSTVEAQKFLTPIPELISASIEVKGQTFELYPWGPNTAYLPVTPREGLGGRLVYAGRGWPADFDGKQVKDSIVLMDIDSRDNWLNAAMFGAAALVFIGDKDSIKGQFIEKNISTPLAFPRYWAAPEVGEELKRLARESEADGVVKSQVRWRNKVVHNIYGLLPGKHPKLKKELIVLDAFYDASSHVLGIAPGADEASSISMLLSLVRQMAKDRPDRSVLFLATAGNGQGLAGMRQFVWTISTRTKLLRKESNELKRQEHEVTRQAELLQRDDPLDVTTPEDRELIWRLVVERAKDKTDALTREIQYQKALKETSVPVQSEDPRLYRRLSWLANMGEMTEEQRGLALELIKEAKPDLRSRRKELKDRRDSLNSGLALRNVLEEYNPVLFLSLYLSSHSPYNGLVEMGETYPVRENLKRIVRAARLADLLSKTSAQTASETGLPDIIRNVARGMTAEDTSAQAAGTSHPCCDVGVLAGLPAVSLMTMDDYRSRWSTPDDTIDRVDKTTLDITARFFPVLLGKLFSSPSLNLALEGGILGLSSLEGHTMFVRQGELFPDQPAKGTIISVFQGNSIFRAMSFMDGTFFIPGLANSRVALQKLILEPYGLDPETGRVAWTADKAQTGKDNYRIKVKSDLASTSLIMFHCLQTDVIGAFNPKDMGHLTKVDLLDAKMEATPLRYWYSRIDGRDTNAISVFLEKGSRFKLILSQSLLGKELFLINSTKDDPRGKGFRIGNPGTMSFVPLQVVNDLHLLLGERLSNLFQHGIVNRGLEVLYETAARGLDESRDSLSRNQYDQFWKNVVSSWARLDTIYAEIESTQRDVLTGVMFFIALFVPFAFCVERYLFSFRGIYRQITAFSLILLTTILIIRALHPAFQLTYSPMVVIIAFFIVGLSVLVSLIIFLRFEKEMEELHNRSSHMKTPQASKWQAFGAGFAIGVSNLNRRKLRTGLTCITLIILTFTVMSFTNVKSLHKTTSTRIGETAPYEGILLRHQYWLSLPMLTLQDMETRFTGEKSIWPRGWIEPSSTSSRTITKVFANQRQVAAEGVLGLGSNPPSYFNGMVSHGRWFEAGEDKVVLLPNVMAARIGLDPQKDTDVKVDIMGDTFRVVGYFDGPVLASLKDLDQNPITPAYLEMSQSEEASEVEIEAMQSGEQVLPSTERFRHADADSTIIMPFNECLNYGGVLKAVTIRPDAGTTPLQAADDLAAWLRYPLFVGEDGTWYHSASTTLRYSGVANLLVPILIVIFITLNTMIGHVHERRREISTYTSVGLAPTHVGFLFIVEALSMAVISTVIGYILAQLSARYMGSSPLFSQLTFNYSSLASVACMFLVFSVVFLAALYPARMAAEIAMPDVNRSWTLPPADGDVLFMNLPFLLKYEEEKGVMGFLTKFYTSHQDVAHGSFIVDETRLDVDLPPVGSGTSAELACLLIRTNIWLAPFDFGIKQRIQLHCCASTDNPGYLEIAIRMIRLSGEHSAWVRANRNFIKALRKQMLQWRLLDREAKAHFQELAPVDYAGQLEGHTS
jgi:hypothetical protein